MSREKTGESNNKVAIEQRREIRRRLRAEVRTEIRPLALGSCAMIASSLSNQAFPRLMGRLIDRSNQTTTTREGRSSDSSISLASSLAMVVLGGGLASFIRTAMLGQAQDDIASRLRKDAFKSLMTAKDLEWFQTAEDVSDMTNSDILVAERKQRPHGTASPGAIGSILNEDVDKVSTSLTNSIANILRSSSSVLFSTYHMLTLNPALFGAAATVIPLVGAAAMLLRKSIKQVMERQREIATIMASYVEERLTHIAMVKMSNREADEVQNYADMQDKYLGLGRVASMQNGLFMGLLFAASSGALMLVVNQGGKAVAAGKMSSGQLTSFATYSFLLGLGTSGIVKALGELMQGMVSAERYYQLLDTNVSKELRQEDSEGEKQMVVVDIADVKSIEFQDVCFGYESTGVEVLKNLSFKLERGKVVALVGKNGSGKSTAASLLAGLYLPSSGRIVLSDGTDFTKLGKASKRKLVQVIPQSAALFNMSILENVRYSNPDATEEDVMRVLALANCTDFVSRLVGGIHFVVGLNGSKLSGGERQRLALARALLSDPAILVMDEPASMLDAEGEAAVIEALNSCQGGGENGSRRALLLITHQTKSLEFAEEVLVMEDGVVVEAGRFEELCSNPKSHLCHLMPDLL